MIVNWKKLASAIAIPVKEYIDDLVAVTVDAKLDEKLNAKTTTKKTTSTRKK